VLGSRLDLQDPGTLLKRPVDTAMEAVTMKSLGSPAVSAPGVGEMQIHRKRPREEEVSTDSTADGSASGLATPSICEEGPRPEKAYKNTAFLNSDSARLIRIMCELEEPRVRMKEHGIDRVVMFFGSARAKPKAQYEVALQEAQAKVLEKPDDARAKASLERLQKQAFLIPMFDVTRDLAQMLTEWSQSRVKDGKHRYVVGTGAGPGMMQAANHGAALAKGPSLGFGISLPFEDGLNPYVTPELGFEFHYFFTRKFWMTWRCMGLVVAPGGLGTCDELFELITLMQTGKLKRALPVVLIGKKFWSECINWKAFVDYGMISEEDANQLHFADTAEEAFEHLRNGLEKLEASGISLNP